MTPVLRTIVNGLQAGAREMHRRAAGAVALIRFVAAHPLNEGRVGRALVRVLRWQVASRLEAGGVVVPFVDDMTLLVKNGMTGATGNVYCGLHEYPEMSFVLHFLRPGDLFLDIGANVGSYSVLAAACGSEIIAFEPGERYEDLLRNMRINGIEADCRRLALGDRNGTVRFTSGLDSINRAAVDGESAGEIEVRRLDDIVNRAPALIKCDVEGYEAAVVAGGLRTFGSAEAIIMELNGQGSRYGFGDRDVIAALVELGFTPHSYDPCRRELRESIGGENTIFVRGAIAHRLADPPRHLVHGRSV